jgi:hypothetical protein
LRRAWRIPFRHPTLSAKLNQNPQKIDSSSQRIPCHVAQSTRRGARCRKSSLSAT